MKTILLTVIFSFLLIIKLNAQIPLPNQTSSIFSGSGNCVVCHSSNGVVLTEDGVDISPITHWRSSMMGNSSKDPFWRAIVAEEVHEHPQLQNLIETTCTKCHAPAGYRQAIQNGNQYYTIADLKQDPLANDGVTCTTCHQINSANYGQPVSYSGGYGISTERIIYGPYPNPLTQPMITNVNYTTQYTPSIGTSEHCATCHTLFTPTIDYNGQIVGMFPEQTPYIEWKNSIYKDIGVPCQTCHMPITNTPVDISILPPWHNTLRTPYWKHLFIGGNKGVNRLMANNINQLQLSASAQNYDTTYYYTEKMLTENSIKVSIQPEFKGGFIEANVILENLAGHKIPTGIPYRRMWIHFKVVDENQNIIFESGKWDTNGEIFGLDTLYEPHYDIITDESQVQIYETILKDVNGDITHNLLRSAAYKKDNRLPPKGFTTTHPSYDTIAIVGDAFTDPNFNKDGSIEGTGKDKVLYNVPINSNGKYSIFVQVCYQSFTPKLINYIRGIDIPDIQQFVSLYNTSDKSPSILSYDSIQVVISSANDRIDMWEFKLNQNYPNPFNPTTTIKFSIPQTDSPLLGGARGRFTTLKIYDILGNEIAALVNEQKSPGNYEVSWDGSDYTSGIYFCSLKSGNYSSVTKMLLLK